MLLTPVFKIWIKFEHFLVIANIMIFQEMAFSLIITPLALLFKLMRRDALGVRLKEKTRYWLPDEKMIPIII